ncbi:MAG: hypothetical protein QXH81_09285 [Thermofilaceae archaeon]
MDPRSSGGRELEEGQWTGYWPEVDKRDPRRIRRKSLVIFVPMRIFTDSRYYVIVLGSLAATVKIR